jgi:hypothetical protein
MRELTGADLITPEDRDFYVLTGKGKTFLDLHGTYSKSQRRLRAGLDCLEKEKALLENMSCQDDHLVDHSKRNPRRCGRQG